MYFRKEVIKLRKVKATPEEVLTPQAEVNFRLGKMEEIFTRRTGEVINLFEYQRRWWQDFSERYAKVLDEETFETYRLQVERFVYELCCYRDESICWLFMRVSNFRSVRDHLKATLFDDASWQDFFLQSYQDYHVPKAENMFRYQAAQKIMAEIYPAWEAKDGVYFEEQIWPKVLEMAGQANLASAQPKIEGIWGEAPLKPKCSTIRVPKKPDFAEIVEMLKAEQWITDGKTRVKKATGLMGCAKFIVYLDKVSQGQVSLDLIEQLSAEYHTPSKEYLDKYLGHVGEWLVNARNLVE